MPRTDIGGWFLFGLAADRPAANTVLVDSTYFATDSGLVSRSNGSAWTSEVTYGVGTITPLSYSSNAMHVAEISSAGSSNAVARSDHFHAGVAQVTSSSSNTLQRGTVNLRPGTGMAMTATDTDGDGEFDTVTFHSTATGGSGSLTVQDEGTPLSTSATTLNFVGSGVTASGTGATKTITIAGSSGGPADAHGCKASRDTSDQSLGNNTFTAVQWNATDTFDTDSMHDPSSNNTRMTIPSISGVTTGLWRFTTYGYTGTNRPDVRFKKNGTTFSEITLGPAANTAGVDGFLATYLAVLSATDYIEVFIRTTAGSGSLIATDSTAYPQFEAEFLGKVT